MVEGAKDGLSKITEEIEPSEGSSESMQKLENELEEFKGFENLLNDFDFIYCEVNEKELYVGCPLITDIDEYLNSFNFKRVLTNITGHGWGDAFYIKTNI